MSAGKRGFSVRVSDDILELSIWENVSEEGQREFLRHAEDMVKGTLALAHRADFRAITMMGIFGAIGVALTTASATLIASGRPSSALIASAATIASGLFIACGLCGAAVRPADFFIAGFEPRHLLNSSAIKDEHRTRVLIAVTQDRIDQNRAAIAISASQTWTAMKTAGISVGAGIVEFLVGLALPHLI
jgi:hypothetical protein